MKIKRPQTSKQSNTTSKNVIKHVGQQVCTTVVKVNVTNHGLQMKGQDLETIT